MTIIQALSPSHHPAVSDRETEVLLQKVLKQPRSWLCAHPDYPLTPAEQRRFQRFLKKRASNCPVAYITGEKEFYGRSFKCDSRALIPRPETEGLVERALNGLPEGASILELGTGCGNIAITLALELKKPADILATDLSPGALQLAEENWRQLKAPSTLEIRFIQADLFRHPEIDRRKPYSLIIANLPYVPERWKFHPDAQPEVIFYEPELALFAGTDGLQIYRRFFGDALRFLASDGRLLVEFNEDQGQKIKPLAKKAFPKKRIKIYQDYAGLDRILEIS